MSWQCQWYILSSREEHNFLSTPSAQENSTPKQQRYTAAHRARKSNFGG